MKKFLSSIWFLALVIAVLAIIFFPPVFDKYKADLEYVEHNYGEIFQVYFVDLNSDGVKEKIRSFEDGNGRLCLQYFSNSKIAPVDQLNFSNEYNKNVPDIYFGDIDKNGFTEIYGFKINGDSLFLNWFEPYPDINGKEHSKFITRVGLYDTNKINIGIAGFYIIDLNRDGSEDIVFPVSSGYSLKPRNIFVFDIKNDTVYQSEYTGINQYDLNFTDLNGDSKFEIIADNSTSGNLKDSIGNLHTDNVAWLQVFNSDLTPFFSPIRFTKGMRNGVKNFVVGKEHKSILTFHFSESDSIKAKVYLINEFGKKTDSVYLPDLIPNESHRVFRLNENKFFVIEGKYLTRISADLKKLGTTILPIPEMASVNRITNLVGSKRQMVVTNFFREKLIILADGFKPIIELEFEKPIRSFTKWNNLGGGKFFVISGSSEYYYQIRRNNFYFLKYPGYLLIYILSVLFIWLLQAARMSQIREKLELQDQVRELQLKALKNQLDPHFMYNTFNTIASVIKQGRNDEAHNVFIQFSKMVRSNLENSTKIYTTLKDEMDFVHDYLSIQKFRFKDMFEYVIDMDKNVNTKLKIPKMLIQIHVENALKHGLRTIKNGGVLHLRILNERPNVKIEITDNGIGREKAKEGNTRGTGIGLKAIQQIIELNNQKGRHKITQKIIDLKEENGKAAGTKVILLISE
ncbi:MAG: histidine kinase [Prolixibacteraceae bacterium]|jgi:hypothetical protein|nr:histidine kinase [Prolixibacteraceae bacterium]MBT6764957.1 histidine kinase [Prolixibacteraceae bacterium]MBT6998050.1 histidine kinase [Prolixibacteraceae bacterium]MBT7395253.1 histidine kinase [Prolixibacteraceae bacterium]